MRLTAPHLEFIRQPRFSRTLRATMVAGGLLAVFCVDRGTGSTPVQHLYYLPIILAALTFETIGGGLAATVAVILYHVANPHLLTFTYEESDIVQIALFLLVGLVTAKLTQNRNLMRRLAATDDLTGLHNLRSFEARLISLVLESRERQLALLVLDVDRLKSLNDTYGHLTGADAVRTVGRILGERLPSRAVACRYGGDEFAVVVPDCSPSEAARVADDLRCAVHATAPELAGRPFAAGTLSLSIGTSCSSLEEDGSVRGRTEVAADFGEALFREADAALYRAKAAGRNRVAFYHRVAPPDGFPRQARRQRFPARARTGSI